MKFFRSFLWWVLLLLAVLVLISPVALASEQATDSVSDHLITALIAVESKGDDKAVGDKHLSQSAYGCLQIRQPCVDDVNRVYGTKYRAKDCLGNRALSVWICQKYLEIYATEKLIGRKPTDQDRARIWNGGPTGYKKSSTKAYWAKVKKAL